MKSFVRMTKLTSISGRASYMTNPDKQEEIVLVSDSVDWQPYIEYEHNKAKTTGKNVEGRELIVALPNEWYKLSLEELQKKVHKLAVTAVGKNTDFQWAVHWNKDRTNLHVHIIFSERTREPSDKRWDRDIYLTADGKIARKKADRARAEDGIILPPVHRKGDLQNPAGFSAKDPQYKSKGWLHNKKQELAELYQSWGVTIDENEILHQYHEGRGSDSEIIKEKNKAVKINNQLYKQYTSFAAKKNHKIDKNFIINKMKAASVKGDIVYIFQDPEKENILKVATMPVADYIEAQKNRAEIIKKKQMDAEFWQRYRSTRDTVWTEFSKVQNDIIDNLKSAYGKKRELYEMCSEIIFDWKGRPESTRMLPKHKLDEFGYFEKRDKINQDIAVLKENLSVAREYMDIAKAHQSIVQSFLKAGADQETINLAMNNYERAMNALKNYAENGDYENRRLKVARFNLEQAQKRAVHVISKIEAAEVSEIMEKCDNEYKSFVKEEPEIDISEMMVPDNINNQISDAEKSRTVKPQKLQQQKERSHPDDR